MALSLSRSLRLCSRRHLSSWRSSRGACSTLTHLPPRPATLTPILPQSRLLSGSTIRWAATADLDKAKERVTTLSEDPGNDVKLKLYALYKQVREY